MNNYILIFDDTTQIFESGIGYFSDVKNIKRGSIETAFGDVFGNSENWNLKLFCPKFNANLNERENVSKHQITDDADSFLNTLNANLKNAKNIFILLDAYWGESNNKIKTSIINWINTCNYNIASLYVYSCVATELALNTKNSFQNRNIKIIKTTTYNRSDCKWLYKGMKKDFEKFKQLADSES